MYPWGKAQESITSNIIVGERDTRNGERDVLEMRRIDECDMEKFGTPDRREKTIAMLGDRSWPNTAKQEGDKKSKTVFI